MGRTDGYDYFLSRALGTEPLHAEEGHSGYFSTPEHDLDPRLFDGTTLKENVRTWLVDTVLTYLKKHFQDVEQWCNVWLAGSGISYQWAADRGNGDLDVLLGFNWGEFWASNPEFQFSEEAVADWVNAHLKQDVWTHTDNISFGGGEHPGGFEITFFLNPHSDDIRDINPYAAYNLRANAWVVEPTIPDGIFPKQYWDYVEDERRLANSLVTKFNHHQASLKTQQLGSPGWTNAIHAMGLVVDQAHALFDDIHLGRRKAFQPDGGGYADFYNFRWQAHKKSGTVQALASLGDAQKQARDLTQTAEHGKPLGTAEQALTAAMMWNRR